MGFQLGQKKHEGVAIAFICVLQTYDFHPHEGSVKLEHTLLNSAYMFLTVVILRNNSQDRTPLHLPLVSFRLDRPNERRNHPPRPSSRPLQAQPGGSRRLATGAGRNPVHSPPKSETEELVQLGFQHAQGN